MSLTFFTLIAFCCSFVRYFVFVLLYRECYGFERAFFTLRCFLRCTPSPYLPQYYKCYGFHTDFFIIRHFLPYTPSRHLEQRDVAPTCFQGFSGSWQFFFEVAGLPNVVQNTDSTHLFVWITQCSPKGITREVLFMCWGPTEHYINLFQVLNPLFDSFIWWQLHILSIRPLKLVMSYDL